MTTTMNRKDARYRHGRNCPAAGGATVGRSPQPCWDVCPRWCARTLGAQVGAGAAYRAALKPSVIRVCRCVPPWVSALLLARLERRGHLGLALLLDVLD